MSTIGIEDFSKVEIRIGKVKEVRDIKESEKLIKLIVDFGEKGEKTIFAGIKKWYQPRDLEGKLLTFVYNLEPRKMMDDMSEGMMLAAETEDGETCVLLIPDKDISPGTRVI
jgi:methionine--tRNA ligase beta chain